MIIAENEMQTPIVPVVRRPRVASRARTMMVGERCIAEETAIAFSYNGNSHAVMMASPVDLEDFAVGLSLTEGIIESPGDISELDVISCEAGLELRMWIPEERMRPYS